MAEVWAAAAIVTVLLLVVSRAQRVIMALLGLVVPDRGPLRRIAHRRLAQIEVSDLDREYRRLLESRDC